MITLVALDPVATRTVRGLGQMAGGGCQVVEIPQASYPDDIVAAGKELRRLRLAADLNLGEAARCAKLTTEQVSGLEHGRYAFASSDDRAGYIAALIVAGGDG